MTLREGAGRRASRHITISEPIAVEKRRRELAYDELTEREQQFQLPISGTADEFVGSGTLAIEFELDFFDAPEQRDSSVAFPQFTFGAFLTGEEAEDVALIMVSASVSEWVMDEQRGAFTGAVVNVALCTPGISTGVEYSGYIHLVFQGFGAPREDIPELDVGT